MITIPQKLRIPELIEGYNQLSLIKKNAFPSALADLLIEGRGRNFTQETVENTLYAQKVCHAFFDRTTAFDRKLFNCLKEFSRNENRVGSYPLAALKILRELNLLDDTPIFEWVASSEYIYSNDNPTVILEQLRACGLLSGSAESIRDNINHMMSHPHRHIVFCVVDQLRKNNLWDVRLAQADFECIVAHQGAGLYHALCSNQWRHKIPDAEKKAWLRSFLYPYAEALFEGGLYRLWPSDDSILSLQDLIAIKAICDANRENNGLLRAKVAYYLLDIPEIYDFIETDWEHNRADAELIDILFTDFKTLADNDQFELTDFQNHIGRLIIPVLNERNDDHSIEQRAILRRFSVLTELVSEPSVQGVPINLPDVQHNRPLLLPQRQRDSTDLRAVANDRESALLKLSTKEKIIYDRILSQYQIKIKNLGGVKNVFAMLRNTIQTHYENNPAWFVNEKNEKMPLPYSWYDFQEMSLSEGERATACRAYYQHSIHTAGRLFLKPNPWISPDAMFVEHDPYDRNRVWANYEDYLPLIVSLWLAAKDPDFEPLDGFTLQSREDEYLRTLALTERAHNWDNMRLNPVTEQMEEYDDLQADNPSCYSGMNRRFFQSLKGHSLTADVLDRGQVIDTLQTLVYRYYHEKLTARDASERFKIKISLKNAFALEATTEELNFLASFNINETACTEWIAMLGQANQDEVDAFLHLQGLNSHLEKFYASASIDHLLTLLESSPESKEEGAHAPVRVTQQGFFVQRYDSALAISELRMRLEKIKSAFKKCFVTPMGGFHQLPADAKRIHSIINNCSGLLLQRPCDVNQISFLMDSLFFREQKNDDDDVSIVGFYSELSEITRELAIMNRGH